MYASDFRLQARMALKGHWGKALLAYFLASLFGVTSVLAGLTNTAGGSGASSAGGSAGSAGSFEPDLFTTDEELIGLILLIVLIVFVVCLVFGLAFSLLQGVIQLGYAKFNLDLIDGKDAGIGSLFSQFKRIGGAFVMNLLLRIFTALWSMLFIIPGIIKSYSYSMSVFIMLENPQLSASEVITESRRLMNGNKWRLFCLNFSFIGWTLLIYLPLIFSLTVFLVVSGVMAYTRDTDLLPLLLIAVLCTLAALVIMLVGVFFLSPYINAAHTAFYRRICNEKNYNLNSTAPYSGGYAAPQQYYDPAGNPAAPNTDAYPQMPQFPQYPPQ